MAEKALQQYRGTSFEKPLLSALKKDGAVAARHHFAQPRPTSSRPSPSARAPSRFWTWRSSTRSPKPPRARRQLELTYRKPGQQQPEQRIVDPYHLANINGEWFLFAFDHLRKDIRTFVPARINAIKPTGKTFERPQKFSLEKRLRDSFGVHSGQGEFDVVIRFNAARRRLHPRKEMARVAATARTEGRRGGIATEAVQPRGSRALGPELGRRCESLEAARIGRGRQEICGGNIEVAAEAAKLKL